MEATPAISIDDSLIFSVYCHCTVLYNVLIVQIISSWAGWKEELAIVVSVSHSQFTLIKCVNWYLLTNSSHLRNMKVFFKTDKPLFSRQKLFDRKQTVQQSLPCDLSTILVSRFLFAKTKSKVQITQNGQYLPTLLQIRSSLMLFVQIRCCTQGSNKIWHVHCSDQARFNDSEKKRGR